ncbi:MAG: class I SAM-dependent methyltransferase [Chloroflexota bacterium]|nr:class I SAM-dependent methyltransferase [Dehalococcoidia bacterium]MDW8255138.1 class I SAM-dependent methyltransferase [Chloroflexota bacterium]
MATLISARDIDELVKTHGRTLSLPADARLTPSAQDRVRELGVEVVIGSQPGRQNGSANGAASRAAHAPASRGAITVDARPVENGNRPSTAVPEQRSQRAMMEFIAGLKGYTHTRELQKIYAEREAAFKRDHGRRPANAAEALALISDKLAFRTDYFINRVSQDMLWRSCAEIIMPHAEELKARLKAAETQGPGKLELNPNLQLPPYFSGTEFHMMPGSYYDEELAGFFFDLGGSIYFSNRYDGARMQRAIVESTPAGFTPTRILDLGCSTGTSTTIWKEYFPKAEVIGIDLAAPMLRYAHMKANEQGFDVTFSQRNAEYTGYPDESFDLVTACILTHELPLYAIRNVFREAYRLLKPGGYLLNGDINPTRTHPTTYAYIRADWEVENNGEPFMSDVLNADLTQIAREAGFREVSEPGTVHKATGQTFPWITLARK